MGDEICVPPRNMRMTLDSEENHMLSAYGDTTRGGRDNNEDALWPRDAFADHLLFAVADGMGGELAGEVASRMAIDAMAAVEARIAADPRPIDDREALLREEVLRANEAICDEAYANPERRGMATTLTAMLVQRLNDFGPQSVPEGCESKTGVRCSVVGGRNDCDTPRTPNTEHLTPTTHHPTPSVPRVWYVHVGDTRLYRLRGGELTLITKDHTVAHLMLRRGHITREDYEKSPMKHNLTSRVGMEEGIDIVTGTEDLAPGDRLLICSDGLWDAMTHDELQRELAEAADPRNAVERLLGLAEAKGTEDNATAVVVFVG